MLIQDALRSASVMVVENDEHLLPAVAPGILAGAKAIPDEQANCSQDIVADVAALVLDALEVVDVHAPDWFERIAAHEDGFGRTIQRSWSIRTLADRGSGTSL